MTRYCSHCATALDPADTTGRCPACGHPYPADPADDATVPEDTLVLAAGDTPASEDTLVLPAAPLPPQRTATGAEATTVAAADGATPATGDGGATATPAARLPVLDLETLRSRLGERFEVLRLVGAGGMGRVFEATDLTLQRKVAIKCITPELGARPEWVARLRHEARIVARLQHPNIVQVYEVIELDGHSLMVMEFVEGEDLQAIVRAGRLGRARLLELIGEACAAVAFAHERGVIHRDIKPGNIMVGADGHCRIMDFGIAGLVDEPPGPETTEAAGSLAYMAPELLERGGPGDTRTDVYALGVTLYYVLTGRLPFRGARGAQLVERIREGRPPPPRSLDASISRDLDAVCCKALSREPEARYGGCDELAADLKRAARGLPVSARRYPLATQVGRALALHPLAFGLALLAAALLFVGVYASASHVHKVAEQTTVSELEDKVRNVAFALTVLVPGDRVAGLATRANPARLAFLDTAIRKTKAFNADIRDAYLVLPEGGGYRVALAWHGNDAARAPPGGAPEPPRGHDTWGETARVENPEAVRFLARAIGGEILVQHEIDTDAAAVNEWRDRLLGYAPVRARDGRGVAVLVIEVSSEAVIAAFRQLERAFRLTLLFGGLLSIGVPLLALAGLVLLWRQAR